MDREVLGWLGALLGVTILAPVLLYLIPGTVLGIATCGPADATVSIGATGTDTLELQCGALRTAVKTAVTVGGTLALTAGVAVFAVADMLRGSYR